MVEVVYRAVQAVYNRCLRPWLPRRVVRLNGVAVARPKYLDRYGDQPDYEEALVNGLRDVVESGDRVVVVGGGWGVTAVWAVWMGASFVVVYEPGDTQIEHVRETLIRNMVRGACIIRHTAVGVKVNVYGESNADLIGGADLPDCDVLELDCEGAELSVLRTLEQRPRAIVVEIHPVYGVAVDAVRDELFDMGYVVVDRGVEDEEQGVVVLTALKKDRGD